MLLAVVMPAVLCVACGAKPAEAPASTPAESETAEEAPQEGIAIPLGTSSLVVAPAVTYVKGELSAEDTDEAQVGYYYSEESAVDFDVYQWAKAEGETLAEAAAIMNTLTR